MKKFFYIPMLLFFLLIAGCSDDSDDNNVVIEIIKSDINIAAEGGIGTIEVSAPGAVSVASSDEWCSVNVSSNIITVTASENKDRSNRTAMILISYNGENITVPVTQKCALLFVDQTNLIFTCREESQMITVTSSFPFNIGIEDDWLTYSVEGNVVTFTSGVNTEDALRTSTITISSDQITTQISVSQYKKQSYSDLLGEWTLYYYDAYEETDASVTVTLSEDVIDKSYSMSGLPSKFSITALYNDGDLLIENGQYLAETSLYYIYLIMTDGDAITMSENVQYVAPCIDGVTYTFSDNSTWPSHKVNGIIFYAIDKITYEGKGGFEQLRNMVLKRK